MPSASGILTNIGETEKTRLDVLSVVLTVPAFGGLVYGLSQIGGGQGGPGTPAVVALAVGVVAMAGVRAPPAAGCRSPTAPLLDLRAFRFRMFTVSVLLLVVAMIALFGAVILLPLYLQEIRGLKSLETGLALLPGGLAMGLLGPFIGRLFDKVGPAAPDRHRLGPDGGGPVAVLHCSTRARRSGGSSPSTWR